MNLTKLLITMAAIVSASLSPAETIVSNGLTFETAAGGECALVSGRNASGKVIIPAIVSSGNTDYAVTEIAGGAFLDNTAMTSVRIPATVRHIGADAFRRCPYLRGVNAESLEAWMNIVFDNETASPLYNYVALDIAGEPLTHLEVPESVTEVRDYAFFNCASLVSAVVGDNVTKIGRSAFDGCESLATVDLGKSVRTVGMSAFNICNSLQSIKLPASVEQIGFGCFYGCTSLAAVELPASVTVVPELAFAGCRSLSDLSFLPSTTSHIGDYAFFHCGGLREAIIPAGVATVGSHAFDTCESLEKAVFSNPATVLNDFIFIECHALKSIQLPEQLDSIPQGTFLECTSLGEISLPEGLKRIGDYAFGNCLSLPYVTFPQSLEQIGNLAFYGCRLLRRLEFGPNMESIGLEAFYELPELREIHCRPIDPIAISFFTFDARADAHVSVYVPEVSTNRYLDNMGWASFDHFYGETAYNPPSRLTIRFGSGGSVCRTVAYGSTLELHLAGPDGSRPSRLEFDGEDVTSSMNDQGVYVTPSITEPSTLQISGR